MAGFEEGSGRPGCSVKPRQRHHHRGGSCRITWRRMRRANHPPRTVSRAGKPSAVVAASETEQSALFHPRAASRSPFQRARPLPPPAARKQVTVTSKLVRQNLGTAAGANHRDLVAAADGHQPPPSSQLLSHTPRSSTLLSARPPRFLPSSPDELFLRHSRLNHG